MEESQNAVPVKGVVLVDQLFGDDALDTKLLQEMAAQASNYIQSFAWCKRILKSYFGNGYGGIVAVFLFRIEPSRPEIDEWLWVVVGDIPPAYLVIEDNTMPSLALEGYIEEMSKWVNLAKRGKSSTKVIPVNVPATLENAALLGVRLKMLGEKIVPAFRMAEIPRA
jgi:hypothetical protein